MYRCDNDDCDIAWFHDGQIYEQGDTSDREPEGYESWQDAANDLNQ